MVEKMNFGSHIMAGCIVGTLLFFQREITTVDILLFIFLSSFMDLDHIVTHLLKKSKYHLRSFVQEPFGILFLGVPVGLLLFWLFGDFIYFWLCFLLFNVHVALDYVCVFETYPLDPFTTKIIKREGSGLILPAAPEWRQRKQEFPHTFDEKYLMIILGVLLLLAIILYVYI